MSKNINKSKIKKHINKIVNNYDIFFKVVTGYKAFDEKQLEKCQLENIRYLGLISKIFNEMDSTIEEVFKNEYNYHELFVWAFSSFILAVDRNTFTISNIFINVFLKNREKIESIIVDIRNIIKNKYSKTKHDYWNNMNETIEKIELLGIITRELENSDKIEDFTNKLKLIFDNYNYEKTGSSIYFFASMTLEITNIVAKKFKLNLENIIKKYIWSLIKILINNNFNEKIAFLFFEIIFSQISKNKKENKQEISHYTSKTSLEKILGNSQLRFSQSKFVNDKDEGTLLGDKNPSPVRTMSFTTKKDSIDLWGNYTNFDGLNIIFDKKILISINKFIRMNKNQVFSFTKIEGGFIQYGYESVNLFQKYFEETKNLLISLCSTTLHAKIESAYKKIKNKCKWLFKKDAWSYEEEVRLIVDEEFFDSLNEKDWKSYNYAISNNDLFIKFSKKLVLEIKLSPYLKHSEIFKNGLQKFLSDNDYSHVKITESEANIR